MSYRLTAPLRIDFCGGFTDVDEIGLTTGVGICSTAIDLYHDPARMRRVGFGVELIPPVREGRPGGFQATIRALGGDERFARSLALRSDLPDSTGLGSSGAMTVMLVAAFDLFHDRPAATRLDLVRRAHQIESGALAFTTGHQDHLLAAFGNTHFIDRLLQKTTKVAPFDLPQSFAAVIDADTFIGYVPRTTSSAAILNDILVRMREDEGICDILGSIRKCNEAMYERLRSGATVDDIFEPVHEASLLRDRLSARMRQPLIDDVTRALRPRVFTTHASGAGGGAFVAYCRPGMFEPALAMLTPLRESGSVRVWFPKVNRRGLQAECLV